MSRSFPKLSSKTNRFGYYEIRWSEVENGSWRSKRKSTNTSDREEAEVALANFLTVRDSDHVTGTKKVREVADFYLRIHSRPRGNDITDQRCLRAPLVAFGEWPAHAIRDDDIEAYTRRRSHGAYGKSKVSTSTIRREIVAFQAALNFGSKKGLIRGKPMFRFPKPQDGPPRDLWLTEEQEREVLAKLPEASMSVRVFVRLALTYGVRKGAIVDLHFGDQVNFLTGTIDFNKPGKRTTRKRRPVVPMTATVRADLEAAFTEKGRNARVVDWTVGDHFKKFMVSIGYNWVTPHVLKHSAITLMLRAGVKPEDVAALTATDIRTILKVYRHHTVDELKSIAEMRRV